MSIRLAERPPDEYTYNGEHFYLIMKAFQVLGLSGVDAATIGEELVHLMNSFKIEMHALPIQDGEYGYYLKKDDVDLAKTLLAAGILYKQPVKPSMVTVITHTPYEWMA
jgi:hypothetical protein